MESQKLQELTAEEVFTADQALHDLDSQGRERDWRGKKMKNELLSLAYDKVDKGKAARLRECGKLICFKLYPDGTKRLYSLTSCRVRLCPICTWRRSLKVYAQTKEIVDYLATQYEYRYVMLTLTVKNCGADQLGETLDRMLLSWNRFTNYAPIAKVCKGWFRALEVVHDTDPLITREMWYGDKAKHIKARGAFYRSKGLKIGDNNPNYDLFHPHFHVLIAVNKTYFKNAGYITQEGWAELWQKALRADYTPRVDVRSVKGATFQDINGAVCEVAKYACKDSDYIVPDDWDLTINTVKVLDRALDKRRLVGYGGVMKEAKLKLKQDDVEDGDLVNIGDDEKVPEGEYRIVAYWWYSGYRQYYEL